MARDQDQLADQDLAQHLALDRDLIQEEEDQEAIQIPEGIK